MYETVLPASKHCPNCNGEVTADARFCKHCAFNLTGALPPTNPAGSAPAYKSKGALLLGGLAVTLLLTLAAIFIYRSRHSQILPAATPSQTMGERAKQVEVQILNGATLANADLAGLSAYELRVLRNLHFARYGRSYERPGLGDYFYTRPWYKPDANYNDKLLTATDKANINLILAQENQAKAAEAAVATVAATNASTPNNTAARLSSTSNSGLTMEQVQIAVEQAFEEMKRYGASHNMPFKEGARVQVLGIQEMPAQHSAKVDVRYINTIFRQPWSFRTEYTRLSEGTAILKRYNDGRWVLTDLKTGDIMTFGGINTRIEIR